MKFSKGSKGIKLLTTATAVRWFGWGLGEAFIPVFLLLFADSFLKVGLLASVYDIVFFLAIPLAGYFADNFKAKKIILASLILYVFIGLGYFLAGLMSAVIFIILARALNGISYSLDQVARETYIMRHVRKSQEARVFGYFDVVTNLSWIVAVVIGIFLFKYMPIHWLLFFIIPTSLIALLIINRMQEKPIKRNKFSLKTAYLGMFKEIKNFNKGLRILAALNFFFGMISSIIYFFAPAISYSQGESVIGTVVIVLAYALPALFGIHLGTFADKKKEKVFFYGILLLVGVLALLAYTTAYIVILLCVFFASLLFEAFYLTTHGLMARMSDRTHLGEVDGSLNGLGALGAVIGPIAFGYLVDTFNSTFAYSCIAAMTTLLLVLVYIRRKDLAKA